MALKICKDCTKCTKSAFGKLAGAAVTIGTMGANKVVDGVAKTVSSTCPICKHRMSDHAHQGAVVVMAAPASVAVSHGASAVASNLSATQRQRLKKAQMFYPRNVETAKKWMGAQWVLLFGMHHVYLGNDSKLFVYFFTFGGLGKWQRADRANLAALCAEADARDGQLIASLTGSPAQSALPSSASQPEAVVREREIVREIVKIRCSHCGTLVDQGIPKCFSCAASM